MKTNPKDLWPVVEVEMRGQTYGGGRLKITHKEGFPSVHLSIDGVGITVDLEQLIKHLAAMSDKINIIPKEIKIKTQ